MRRKTPLRSIPLPSSSTSRSIRRPPPTMAITFYCCDTSLNGLQKYHPGRAGSFLRLFLSNTGAAYQPRWFSFNASPGLLIGRNELDPYLYDPDSLRFLSHHRTFTDLYYVLGQFNEQLFHLRHTQNFGKDMNVAVDLNKYLSQVLPERTQGRHQPGHHLLVAIARTTLSCLRRLPLVEDPERRERRVAAGYTVHHLSGSTRTGRNLPRQCAHRPRIPARSHHPDLRLWQYDYTYDTLVTDSVVGKSFAETPPL